MLSELSLAASAIKPPKRKRLTNSQQRQIQRQHEENQKRQARMLQEQKLRQIFRTKPTHRLTMAIRKINSQLATQS